MRIAAALACVLAVGAWLVGTVVATTYSIIIPVKAKGSGPLFRIQREGKWGYITRTGRVAIEPRFSAARDFFEDVAAVETGEKWGYINLSGDFVIPPRFDAALDFKQERAIVAVDKLPG